MSAIRHRLVRFYAVGLVGIAVQLAALDVLTRGAGLDYLWSTVLAVEVAIIHNFLWHQRWTWRCRTSSTDPAAVRLRRFWTFNLTTGMVSIVINLVVTSLLVECAGMPYVIANLGAIASGSAITFVLGETVVFNGARQSAASLPGRAR